MPFQIPKKLERIPGVPDVFRDPVTGIPYSLSHGVDWSRVMQTGVNDTPEHAAICQQRYIVAKVRQGATPCIPDSAEIRIQTSEGEGTGWCCAFDCWQSPVAADKRIGLLSAPFIINANSKLFVETRGIWPDCTIVLKGLELGLHRSHPQRPGP